MEIVLLSSLPSSSLTSSLPFYPNKDYSKYGDSLPDALLQIKTRKKDIVLYRQGKKRYIKNNVASCNAVRGRKICEYFILYKFFFQGMGYLPTKKQPSRFVQPVQITFSQASSVLLTLVQCLHSSLTVNIISCVVVVLLPLCRHLAHLGTYSNAHYPFL